MLLSNILQSKKNVYYLGESTEEAVSFAEQELGLKFADEYRDYLKQYSLLSYGVHELTGLCNSSRLNVVDATKREKAENSFLKSDMYLIEQIGVENLTIWQNTNGEIFEVSYKKEPKKIYDSLVLYIASEDSAS